MIYTPTLTFPSKIKMTNNNEENILQQPMNIKEHKKAVKEGQLSGTLKL